MQIQSRIYVLDHAGCTPPAQQRERDHTDQEYIYLPCLTDVEHGVGIDYLDNDLSEVMMVDDKGLIGGIERGSWGSDWMADTGGFGGLWRSYFGCQERLTE